MGAIEKSPDAFRTISEVAETLDIPAHVLRFWESRFTQIKPVKRGGGRRYYRPQDVNLLRGIRDLLYRDGLTIKGVQKILREQGVKHVASLGEESEATQQSEAEPRTARPEPPETAATAAPPRREPEPRAAPAEPEEIPAAAQVPPSPPAEAPAPEAPTPEPAPLRRPILADVPVPPHTRKPQEVQYDLFAEETKQARPPFPPDPAEAKRKEALRRMISKLQTLRDKMAAQA